MLDSRKDAKTQKKAKPLFMTKMTIPKKTFRCHPELARDLGVQTIFEPL